MKKRSKFLRKQEKPPCPPVSLQRKTHLKSSFEEGLKDQITDRPSHILLAVSGGVDSVVMGHLFHMFSKQFDVSCEVLHVDFGLREESEKDANFVRELSNTWRFPCFVSKAETLQYAVRNKISVQMAARVLRYQWFEEMRQKRSADYIATAHHLDDSLERSSASSSARIRSCGTSRDCT